jgi:hypothetical protein
MDRSNSDALLVLMKCGLVLVFGPLLAGIAVRDTGFPTGNSDLDEWLVTGALFLVAGVLLYRGFRYQRRTFAIGKLQALAAVAVAMGAWVMYKGARCFWQLRHDILPAS